MAVAALAALLIVLRVVAFGAAVPSRRTVALQPGAIQNIAFSVTKGQNYGLLVSVPDISALGRDDLLGVAWRDPSGSAVEKTLHAGDADLYVTVRPERSGEAVVRLDAEHLAGPLAGVEVELIPIPAGKRAIAQLGAASHANWRDAQPIELGSTVFATADDRSYIPSLGTPGETFAQMLGGIHWYRFDYAGPGDKLKISQLGSTRMAGPPEAMEFERKFIDALMKARSFEIDGSKLVLVSQVDQLHFVAR